MVTYLEMVKCALDKYTCKGEQDKLKLNAMKKFLNNSLDCFMKTCGCGKNDLFTAKEQEQLKCLQTEDSSCEKSKKCLQVAVSLIGAKFAKMMCANKGLWGADLLAIVLGLVSSLVCLAEGIVHSLLPGLLGRSPVCDASRNYCDERDNTLAQLFGENGPLAQLLTGLFGGHGK